MAGWYTTHLSNIYATLGSRLSPYSLRPNVTCVDRPQPKTTGPLERPAGTDDHAYRRPTMVSESGVPPRLRARSFATLHHTTQLFRLPFTRGIPLPLACTEYRPRLLTTWPRPSEAAGSMPIIGRALLGLSRLAVSNRLQPVSLGYANHASLHQPCTRRTHL